MNMNGKQLFVGLFTAIGSGITASVGLTVIFYVVINWFPTLPLILQILAMVFGLVFGLCKAMVSWDG
jgi:hypothetical protein